MNASYEWLREFCPVELSPEQVRDLITARAATVEELAPLRADLAPFVVAHVVEAARHPDSDHLSVTKVDAGTGELLDVVCGAPNVRAGGVYPFAMVGVTMPNGLKIERRKIRGAISNGMLCSPRELGLGQDHDGLLELETNAPAGTPLLAVLQAGDVRLGIDVLPNRPDLLSHLGIARELSAATGVALREPAIPGAGDAPIAAPASDPREASSGGVTVRVDDVAGAPRYMAAVLRGVRVGASPDWLVSRLVAVGARSINNVVDATNYMLHGYGQPMHAFDVATLAGSTVVVRRARDGERLVTLDGVERTLDASMTVIADAERVQAVAGVMGGRASEVTDATTDVLLEVAYFEPRAIRRTRRALGLSTDASYRFEREVDRAGASRALAQAVRLIAAVAGGRLDGAPIDIGGAGPGAAPVALRPSRVAQVLGVAIDDDEIPRHLESIGFDVTRGEGGFAVRAPSWRADIVSEIDLVEEIARLHGYDALPTEIRPFRLTGVPDDPQHLLAERLRDLLVGAGLYEVRPMPFVAGADETHTRVANPLAENEAHLRRSILETLPRRAEFNLAHRQGDVRLFEIGATFAPTDARLPVEEMRVAALVMGRRRPPHFTEPAPPAYDEWDAKALAEELARAAFSGGTVVLLEADSLPVGVAGEPLWSVAVNGQARGVVVRLALDAPPWASSAYGVELVLGVVSSADVAPMGASAYVDPATVRSASRREVPRHRELPTTPEAEFDLGLVVADATPAAEVEAVIRRSAGELLERLVLFDQYRGPGVPPGHRSLAWRLTFRDPVRTLRDKEVEGRRKKILASLERELGVTQRTG
jgi:phenylalanyl-tRNA synthetase beta chain